MYLPFKTAYQVSEEGMVRSCHLVLSGERGVLKKGVVVVSSSWDWYSSNVPLEDQSGSQSVYQLSRIRIAAEVAVVTHC